MKYRKESIQQKAQTTDIETIIKIMKKAYKNNQLNDTQTKNWERITKESEGMANTDQSGRAVMERVIRQEYMVYLSYQQDFSREVKLWLEDSALKFICPNVLHNKRQHSLLCSINTNQSVGQ